MTDAIFISGENNSEGVRAVPARPSPNDRQCTYIF